MQYQNVCLESFGYALPNEIVTSAELERRLEPVYQRLRLPQGRLELITGIRERRFWPAGTLPSEKSVLSAVSALEASQIDPGQVGAIVHASVCRDHLEPATACAVHHQLKLPSKCLVYDLSNACLGILNGILQVANMIELGQIRAGIVVGSEGGRELVETTVAALNTDQALTRSSIKSAIASLTIGSGSCAVLLVDQELSQAGNRLHAAVAHARTDQHQLCQSGADDSVSGGMQPLMNTASERLLDEGIRTGKETFASFLTESGWRRTDVHKTCCHQVGSIHRRLMLESLEIDATVDYSTLEWLGNTGSVALPITMALAAQSEFLQPGDNVGLLGIGSGINCVMLAVQWEKSLVQ